MVCSGILSIDQLQDHVPPVSLVCQRIPRSVLEETYGIDIPRPKEGEDEDRPPYAHELLSAYGCKYVVVIDCNEIVSFTEHYRHERI